MAYEHMTFEVILSRLMSRVREKVDKREGSLIYNALAPAAAEIQYIYMELDSVLKETFAEGASRPNLIKRCAERGISPFPSTHAEFKAVFNVNVPVGSRFTNNKNVFSVIEKLENHTFRLVSETSGSRVNQSMGMIIPVEYIVGLTSADLTELLVPGEDEEDTEALRKRYFESFSSQAFGGNRADYLSKVNQISGVGGSKVMRVKQSEGRSHIGVVIIDSTFDVPSNTLIKNVQTALDPTQNSGEGLGIAPIGHEVKVSGVTPVNIDVSSTVTYADGWDWQSVQPYFDSVLDEYLLELRKQWQSENQLIVRIVQIESRLLNLAGVVDITNTSINGQCSNFVLTEFQIPKRGLSNG